ncbi:MAG: hypothetical protein V3W10_07530 [candidate division NC10 bacterium]|jgi:membrane protein YqaA with SNARE-associated domain
MQKLLAIVAAILGGWIGWWLGAHRGLMTAFVLSMVGTGAGMYAWRRITEHYLR